MLNSIYSVQTRKYGVADVNEDGFFVKTVVPLNYKQIVFQNYGIVAYNFDGTCNAYLCDGKAICSNALNPLFLSDNLLLISNKEKKCYIIDYSNEKPMITTSFDTILFFMGSQQQAIPYSADANLANFFNTPDYRTNGAHLEDLVAVRIDNAWGVINRKTNTIHAEFNNSILVQCIGSNIAAKGFDGIARRL